MIELSPLARVRTIQIGRIYGYCPVQAEGLVNNLPFYFRARHDFWVFAIAESSGADPVQVAIGNALGFRLLRPYGRRNNCDASFMSHRQARALVVSSANYYLNEGNRHANRG